MLYVVSICKEKGELKTGNEKCDVDTNRKQHDEEKLACSKTSESRKEKHSTLWNLIT
jgi:hypothetical protein